MESAAQLTMENNRFRKQFDFSQKWKILSCFLLFLLVINLCICIYLLTVTSRNTSKVSNLEEDEAVLRDKKLSQTFSNRGKCGGVIHLDCSTGDRQVIHSPNYPESYDNDLLCNWNIQMIVSKPDPQVRNYFIFMAFDGPIDIENSTDCSSDVLQVRGDGPRGKVLASYCGRNTTVADIDYNGPINVLLKTDHTNTATGFKAHLFCEHKTGGVYPYPLSGLDQTYVRWGLAECPSGLSPLYSGTAVGYAYEGIANLICMDTTGEQGDKLSTEAQVYFPAMTAAEFTNPADPKIDKRLVQCAVCLVQHAIMYLNIGSSNCPPTGWTVEYSGYLMSANATNDLQRSSTPICVDKDSESPPSPVALGGAPKVLNTGYQSGSVPCVLCRSTASGEY